MDRPASQNLLLYALNPGGVSKEALLLHFLNHGVSCLFLPCLILSTYYLNGGYVEHC